jgi:hypothetical protein
MAETHRLALTAARRQVQLSLCLIDYSLILKIKIVSLEFYL